MHFHQFGHRKMYMSSASSHRLHIIRVDNISVFSMQTTSSGCGRHCNLNISHFAKFRKILSYTFYWEKNMFNQKWKLHYGHSLFSAMKFCEIPPTTGEHACVRAQRSMGIFFCLFVLTLFSFIIFYAERQYICYMHHILLMCFFFSNWISKSACSPFSNVWFIDRLIFQWFL